MGFQHGLSGLGASSRNLDVIGHNIANANTVGAKASRAEFADVFASARGSGSGFSGLGVQVAQVTQQFSQGDLTQSSNPLDMAVNGSGFFRVQNETGEVSYTRNGQFKLDNQGFIVSGKGHRLTGYPVDLNGEVQPAAAQPIRISSADIEPRQTENLRAVMNLDTRDAVPTVPFDIQDTESYNSATSLDVFDQQGRDTSLAMFFRKTGRQSVGRLCCRRRHCDRSSTGWPVDVWCGRAPGCGGITAAHGDHCPNRRRCQHCA